MWSYVYVKSVLETVDLAEYIFFNVGFKLTLTFITIVVLKFVSIGTPHYKKIMKY